MRALVLAVVAVSSTAMAQSISGSLTAVWLHDTTVRIEANLSCSLTCPPAAPTLHFGFSGGVFSVYASADPMERGGFSSTLSGDLEFDGTALVETTSFKPGQTAFVRGQSATCWCGNRTGEGGYITLDTPNVVIPPTIGPSWSRTDLPATIVAQADLRGGEQVELSVEGGGLSQSRTFGVADLDNGYAKWVVDFTQGGTATLTATLRPSGISASATMTVEAGPDALGGGNGGTGGGGGGGGSASTTPEGCAAFGGPAIAFLALLLLRRRSS